MKGFVKNMLSCAVMCTLPAAAIAQTSIQTPVTPVNNQSIVLSRGDSFKSGDGRFQLIFQQDGNFVLYQGSTALWASRTTPIVYKPNNLPGAQYLVLRACYARFQSDGNLVVVGATGVFGAIDPCQNPDNTIDKMTPLWSSNTYQYPGSKLDVQNDGNVVITSADGRPVWSTRTCCH